MDQRLPSDDRRTLDHPRFALVIRGSVVDRLGSLSDATMRTKLGAAGGARHAAVWASKPRRGNSQFGTVVLIQADPATGAVGTGRGSAGKAVGRTHTAAWGLSARHRFAARAGIRGPERSRFERDVAARRVADTNKLGNQVWAPFRQPVLRIQDAKIWRRPSLVKYTDSLVGAGVSHSALSEP